MEPIEAAFDYKEKDEELLLSQQDRLSPQISNHATTASMEDVSLLESFYSYFLNVDSSSTTDNPSSSSSSSSTKTNTTPTFSSSLVETPLTPSLSGDLKEPMFTTAIPTDLRYPYSLGMCDNGAVGGVERTGGNQSIIDFPYVCPQFYDLDNAFMMDAFVTPAPPPPAASASAPSSTSSSSLLFPQQLSMQHQQQWVEQQPPQQGYEFYHQPVSYLPANNDPWIMGATAVGGDLSSLVAPFATPFLTEPTLPTTNTVADSISAAVGGARKSVQVKKAANVIPPGVKKATKNHFINNNSKVINLITPQQPALPLTSTTSSNTTSNATSNSSGSRNSGKGVKKFDTVTRNLMADLKPLILEYLEKYYQVYANPGKSCSFSGEVDGERTMIIMTARVAQKSYGYEKRFLCPPPTVHLKGRAWWWHPKDMSQVGAEYVPPQVFVSIPSDAPSNLMDESVSDDRLHCNPAALNAQHQAQPVEWNYQDEQFQADSGDDSPSSSFPVVKPLDGIVEEDQIPKMGRIVAKQLHISDAEEKRKKVQVLAKVRIADQTEYTFQSCPIKVISKPSKKRQSIKNLELCIHHGSTISLFNRIRSQTVSTKYLGVGSVHSSYPAFNSSHLDNSEIPSPSSISGSGTLTKSLEGSEFRDDTCFVARTSSWDPFVIWLVDPTKDRTENDPAEVIPGLPSPPAMAKSPRRHVFWNLEGKPSYTQLIPIHYNQLVVLQCLSTGMVSPVLRIRKVEKTGTAMGGVLLNRHDEALGDPVSQLHKVAFEIATIDPSPLFPSRNFFPHASPPLEADIPQGPGEYLVCLKDLVAKQTAIDGSRSLFTAPKASGGATSGSMEEDEDEEDVDFATSAAAAVERSGGGDGEEEDEENRKPSSKHRKRKSVSSVSSQSSLSPMEGILDANSQPRRRLKSASNAARTAPLQSGAAWMETVGDQAVWTLVGTDIATFTFYQSRKGSPSLPSPPPSSLVGSGTSSGGGGGGHNFPMVDQALLIQPPSSTSQQTPQYYSIRLLGDNFSPDLTVWFGDLCSARTEFITRKELRCHFALDDPFGVSGGGESWKHEILPMLLVRPDGTIYRMRKTLPRSSLLLCKEH